MAVPNVDGLDKIGWIGAVNMYYILVYAYVMCIYIYSQLPKSWRNPKNLEISLGEGFCGSRGDAAFSLCLG